MKRYLCTSAAVGLAMLLAAPVWAQQVVSYPVDMSDFWNLDGFAAGGSDADDPFIGEFGLDDGGARVRSWTMPDNFVDGEPNYTQDGLTQFLLGPVFDFGAFDSYRPTGDTIPAPEVRAYDRLYLAAMSGNGEFPGSTWAGQDIMTINYADGTTDEIPIGVVNDWFWNPPAWFVPESGNPNEIVVDILCHASDPDDWDHIWDWWPDAEPTAHDYGQYRYANGDEQFITYRLPYVDGATLFTEMWGNILIEISTEDPAFDPDFPMDTLYNSAEEDQIYPGNGDGYMPNRDHYEFDLSDVLPAGTTEFFLRFRDAAPGQAGTEEEPANWGARIHRMALFTGPVVLSSAGDRLFPNLVRTGDGAAPDGGLILIRKSYRLDNEREVESITMPDLTPNAAPYLTLFGVTFGVLSDETGVTDFEIFE